MNISKMGNIALACALVAIRAISLYIPFAEPLEYQIYHHSQCFLSQLLLIFALFPNLLFVKEIYDYNFQNKGHCEKIHLVRDMVFLDMQELHQ